MEGLQEIVVDYITKPFYAAELVNAVRTYLGYLDRLRSEM
jgi:DNA-binding response OmpR family regulator